MNFFEKVAEIFDYLNKPYPDLQYISKKILDIMIKIFKPSLAEIVVFNQDYNLDRIDDIEDINSLVKFRLTYGYTPDKWQLLVDNGILRNSIINILKTKKSIVVEDIEQEPEKFRKISEQLGTGSWMNYVLVANDRAIANIHLSKKEKGFFRQRDLPKLALLGKFLATAINICNLWERESQLVLDTVKSLNAAVEARDPYTAGHAKRVMFYSTVMAKLLDFSKERIETLKIAALLHDIGKVGIKDSVLNKPGRLTKEEKELIKKHVEFTDKILENLPYLDEVRKIATLHHEYVDGSGYYHGYLGDDIPVESKIIAIADAFDAMTTDRPYRKALFVEESIDILLAPHIKQWDKKIVSKFVDYLKTQEFKKLAIENGLIKFYDNNNWFYDSDNSILKFKNFQTFFR